MPIYRGNRKGANSVDGSRLSTIDEHSNNGIVTLHPTSAMPARKRRPARIRSTIVLLFLFLVVFGSFYLSYGVVMDIIREEQVRAQKTGTQSAAIRGKATRRKPQKKTTLNTDKCDFRSYPPNRLYGLHSEKQPIFLADAEYIRGKRPIILNPEDKDGIEQSPAVKVCLDTTSWESLKDKDGQMRLPFTDGQNPSIASLSPNPYSSSGGRTRLDPHHIQAISSTIPPEYQIESLFLGVSIFGSGQCKFGLTPQQVNEYRFSLHDEPQGGKRAVINVLTPPTNDQSGFQTIYQTTLLLEKDKPYGGGPKRALKPEKTATGYARIHQEFDDPRLFFYRGRIWILYRNGPLFGYKDQLHNPLHFEKSLDGSGFIAFVRASETVRVCCGRNIALIGEEPRRDENGKIEWLPSPSLRALTWVDPVTVVEVDLGDMDQQLRMGRKLEEGRSWSHLHRRLAGSKTSNIHGTNGYMVPLKSSGELLGIAHFHRPEHRKESEYALHGHHYTHAFFTIARDASGGENFQLKRISDEFVFRSNSIALGDFRPPNDGDIIQFSSGVDVVGDDAGEGRLIISYGINDCEGAVFSIPMSRLQMMLKDVAPKTEVVDLMSKKP